MKVLNKKDWSKYLKGGFRVYFGSAAACPHALIKLFLEEVHQYHDIEVIHGLTLGEMPWLDDKYQSHLNVSSFFLSPKANEAVQQGRANYIPCYTSEVPQLFSSGIIPIDLALIQVTPPDKNGFCSFGAAVASVQSACKSAKYVIAQINPKMPRTLGQSFIHIDDIDAVIHHEEKLPTYEAIEPSRLDLKIGRYVSLLIKNGATIHSGIGRIPEAVLSNLNHHEDLGIHSDIFTDGMMRLMKEGIINNRKKSIKLNRCITSFALGSQQLYDYIDNNPHIEFHPNEYVNKPSTIARNSQMVSINAAIEVDLTGQAIADAANRQFYGGTGGQIDFIRGAGMCEDGTPIIAIESTSKDGKTSRIVAKLNQANGGATSRGDIHYVVTEYGIATLVGRSIQERALELIQVAHPDFREQLLEEFKAQHPSFSFQETKPQSVAEFDDLIIKKVGKTDYHMRSLHSSDLKRIQEFFYSHSEATLLQRYRHVPKNMSVSRAYQLVNVDQEKDLALTIFERQGPREVIHAIVRYFLLNDDKAEMAFLVGEDKQGQGLGSALLREVIRIASKRSIKTLVAYVRADNLGMQNLLKKYQFQEVGLPEDGETAFELHVPQVQYRHLKILLDRDCLLHESLDPHPESPERLKKLYRRVKELNHPDISISPKIALASHKDLQLVHTPEYLQSFETACLSEKSFFMDKDSFICYDSYNAARSSAGLALEAVQNLLHGEKSFVLSRPPGHHAYRDKASGFCFFNNIALAAEKILEQEPGKKVLIVDFDVHHGNGTQEIFYDRDDVYTYSIHADPEDAFPYMGYAHELGRGKGRGYNLNIPMPIGSTGTDWLISFAKGLREVKAHFQPDYILVSAGYDGHHKDPMKLMKLRDEDYIKITKTLLSYSADQCNGRIAFFLEGGYSGDVLEEVLMKTFPLLVQ